MLFGKHFQQYFHPWLGGLEEKTQVCGIQLAELISADYCAAFECECGDNCKLLLLLLEA